MFFVGQATYCCFLRVIRFPPLIKLTATIQLLLKMALNTITLAPLFFIYIIISCKMISDFHLTRLCQSK
jgi:hypothetical protein